MALPLMAHTSVDTSSGIDGTTMSGDPSKTSGIGRAWRLNSALDSTSIALCTSASFVQRTRLGTPRDYDRQIDSGVSGAANRSHKPRNAITGRARTFIRQL